ncbi:Mpo1 family 2-hydroxy fatty acid dioxygenase [Alteromonas sp. a30]|uniref:Mpo1 family 2-hydroxy fatty acid dioxygenase n=1 Tax=Alteromonas sp. a30 TaxID=2730917 RepID=UPI002280D4FC|nr:Mpo1-like protein [Alteromonas sp. a30]MCY7296618.1 DUF962 domain-containing protein [Alteromonas sp. a30]
MKSITEQLSQYKSVHLNKKNVATHFVGVPLILWSLALFLSSFQLPIWGVEVSLLGLVVACTYLYYIMLKPSLGLVAICLLSPLFYHANSFQDHPYLYGIAISVFLIGWAIQFLGHHYEKAKPAFVDDIAQLAIGPLFLVSEICFALNLFKELDERVESIAQEKRKLLM